MVSIGPKYRNTIKPDIMENVKVICTYSFFHGTNTTWEQFLRDNLSVFKNELDMDRLLNNWSYPDDELMEMFILDGCFIIELFRDNEDPERQESDFIFKSEQILYTLLRDMILPDNQLPFMFLEILFQMSRPSNGANDELTRLALKFLQRIVPNQKLDHTLPNIGFGSSSDLLSMVYDGLSWLRPEANNNYNSNVDKDDKWNLVISATELQEFGVEFKMMETDNLINITLNKGVLHIPRIRIRYGTAFSIDVLLRFENSFDFLISSNRQRQGNNRRRRLADYVWFMNSLVKSVSDVQLLRQKNIIDNLSELPDDAAILKFLKDLYESVTISPIEFSYKDICKGLNSHCNHRRNRWLAKLKRDYFNSPWAVISFFAAFLLLILTVVQTEFSVASYYNQG